MRVDDDEEDDASDNNELTDAERRVLEASDAAPRRRSGRLQRRVDGDEEAKEPEEKSDEAGDSSDEDEDAAAARLRFGIEELDDAEDSGEDSDPPPSQRRRARYEPSSPPREASSCEFTADGKSILCCIMKSDPLLFENSARTAPFVALQSTGLTRGYSNTCTLKSAAFAGPDERFMLAGSDNFGLYLWDRTLPASDVLWAPGPEDAADRPTFLNAFKIIRGHRSIPNNMRFHPDLMQIYSCGVEKVVRVFHCTAPADPRGKSLTEAQFEERNEEQIPEGDVLTQEEAQHILQRHHLLPPGSPASVGSGASVGSKRKERGPGSSPPAEQEKKARSDSNAPEAKETEAETDVTMAAASSSPPAAAASPAPAASASASAAEPSRASRRRGRSPRPAGVAAADSSRAATSAARSPSPELDPLYRMVRTYMRPRLPFTRLQCAFLLSGGASTFGAAQSLFEDLDPDEASELAEGVPAGGADDMGEDRQCMAQFDFYVAKTAAGEPVSDFEDDETEEDEDEEEQQEEQDEHAERSAADE